MSSKLWFVTDGVKLIGVFERKTDAEHEMNKYQDDPDFCYFDAYSLYIDDLEEYPEEYDIALNEGFIS